MKLTRTDVTNKVLSPMVKAGMDETKVMKEISFALQIYNSSKGLQKCSAESMIGSILNVANIGLTLNPVYKLSYLIPYWNSTTNQMECKLEASYQGLLKLLTDAGSVKALTVHVVYDGDEFQVDFADFNNPVKHKSNPFLKDRTDWIGVYALALLPNGVKQVEAMSRDDIYKIRERSESYKAYVDKKVKSCVWVTDELEMARKTVVRRIVKYLPKSEDYEKVANAISLDEHDYKASERQKQFAYRLLENSSLVDRKQIADVESDIETGDSRDVSLVIEFLMDNQIDNGRLSKTEINQKVKEIAS